MRRFIGPILIRNTTRHPYRAAGIFILVVLLAVCVFSRPALAAQEENFAAMSDADFLASLQIVEEVDLGDQGIFPADHFLITVHADGEVYTVDAEDIPADELYEKLGITLLGRDYLEQEQNEYGYDLYVNRYSVEIYAEDVILPFETEYVPDASMAHGSEVVTVQGQNGLRTDSYEVQTLNGSTFVNWIGSEVVLQPVNERIAYGTSDSAVEEIVSDRGGESDPDLPDSSPDHASESDVGTDRADREDSSSAVRSGRSEALSSASSSGSSGGSASLSLTDETIVGVDAETYTFTTSSGTVYSYSEALSCRAYSYTGGGTTALGTTAHQGTVAVDPSVIPLGSRLFIVTDDGSVVYGVATAEDSGTNISGNTVDLYYDTSAQCSAFGTRSVTVYILN